MSDNQFDFGPAAKQIESLKGAANGLASLDSNGLVPSSQLPGATQSVAGLMSAADKTKLDGIATGATANVVSDSLSDTSTTNALSAAKGKALNDSVTALNTQIANNILLAIGTLSSSDGFTSYIPYPQGNSSTTIAILGIMVKYNNQYWRYGEGINSAGKRLFATCETDGIRIYNDDASLYGKDFRLIISSLVGKSAYNS